MPRQIADEEYNFLQGRRQVADFVESIYNDPGLNREAKALIKKKYPGIQIPDYDLENKIEDRFAKEKSEREEAENKKRQKEEEERFAQLRAKTQKDYGFTDDAMTRMEKMMLERNIGDYEAAAELMAKKEPKVSDSSGDWHGGRWDHAAKEGFQEISKDPEKWARNEIMTAIRADQERERGGR